MTEGGESRMRPADCAIVLSPSDNVAVARRDLPRGAAIETPSGPVTLREAIPVGHKIAIAALEA
ncbi:MAG: hypothetical protein FJX74_25990, partial [Armatimonadetes bacterium]|nr:hypothetical protein [Armatimonadota bacterium]